MMPTVRVRIMLWFALMMAVITACVVVFMAIVGNDTSGGNAERQLIDAVSYNVDELDYDNGQLDVDEFDVYRRGVFTEVFDAEGTLRAGTKMFDFEGDDTFVNARIRSVEVNGEKYLVLDQYVENPDGDVWIRGVTSADNSIDAVHTVATLSVILIPILIGLTLLGGWFIAGRAMRPVRRITKAADAISDGNDLSARIGLAPGRDEIHRLAATFDRMFCRLERSFQTEKQFASDASHELRTPTAVILAECELADRTAKTVEDYKESMAVIERQANGMAHIIDQMLRTARLEQGTEKTEFMPQDVSALTTACCEDAEIANSGAHFTTDIAEGVVAEVDASLFMRLVRNLVDNAVKYGGGEVTVRLSHSAADEVLLSVSDNGNGISEADREKIWQRFWRADAARGQGEGSGLGLHLVKRIAELHGGSVSYTGKAGEGATFTFRFPAHRTAPAAVGSAKKKKEFV